MPDAAALARFQTCAAACFIAFNFLQGVIYVQLKQQPNIVPLRKLSLTLLAAAVSALALTALPAAIQGTGGGGASFGSDVQHKAMATATRALSSDVFDAQYVWRGCVSRSPADRPIAEKAQKDAKDVKLKATVTKRLPTVKQHLAIAWQMNTTTAKNNLTSLSSG